MTDRKALLAECEAVCTSGCHADDCEHHGHIPVARSRPAGKLDVERLRDEIAATLWAHNQEKPTDEFACDCGPDGTCWPHEEADLILASSTTTEAGEEPPDHPSPEWWRARGEDPPVSPEEARSRLSRLRAAVRPVEREGQPSVDELTDWLIEDVMAERATRAGNPESRKAFQFVATRLRSRLAESLR